MTRMVLVPADALLIHLGIEPGNFQAAHDEVLAAATADPAVTREALARTAYEAWNDTPAPINLADPALWLNVIDAILTPPEEKR